MSNEALNWTWTQNDPSPGAKFVLAALADQVRDGSSSCAPGIGRLMAMTNQSDRSVTRHLGELVSLGLLRRERRNTGYQSREADLFTLSLTANVADSDALDANMATSEPAKMADSVTTRQNDTSQNGGIKEPKNLTTKKTTSPKRDDVERICQHLVDRIVANGSRRPVITEEWRTEARRLIDKDKRTEDQIHKAIDWCQDSAFWRGNVMSMPKLREKYDQLRLAAKAPATPVDQRDAQTRARIAARQSNPLSSALL